VSTPFPGREEFRRRGSIAASTSIRVADPAEPVAAVAAAKRELLLRVHRHRLRREDLEDCYSQATLELLMLARRGRVFASRAHVGNALEQRFLARVQDRRRALSGRSPITAAIEGSIPFGAADERLELPDTRSEPQRVALARDELARLTRHLDALSADQRLVLGWQLGGERGCEEFCRIHKWTPEKYRKVAQRARARLRALLSSEDAVPAVERASEQAPGTRS
jgi:DNA-directed RNA polymerase specialized sigma24 family protein